MEKLKPEKGIQGGVCNISLIGKTCRESRSPLELYEIGHITFPAEITDFIPERPETKLNESCPCRSAGLIFYSDEILFH